MDRRYPPPGPVWVYNGAGWSQGQLLKIVGDGALVSAVRAGSRNASTFMVYDPRNVTTERKKKK